LEVALIISSIFLWLIVLFNLLLTLVLVRRANTYGNTSRTDAPGLSIGEQAPAFAAENLEGEIVTLESYTQRGRATALLFISAHCQPCHEMIATLGELIPGARQTGVDLVLVSSSDHEQTETLLDDFHLDIPTLIAVQSNNSFFSDYKITSTPSYYVIDEDGTILSAGHPMPMVSSWKAFTVTWIRAAKLATSRRR